MMRNVKTPEVAVAIESYEESTRVYFTLLRDVDVDADDESGTLFRHLVSDLTYKLQGANKICVSLPETRRGDVFI